MKTKMAIAVIALTVFSAVGLSAQWMPGPAGPNGECGLPGGRCPQQAPPPTHQECTTTCTPDVVMNGQVVVRGSCTTSCRTVWGY
jgi:hypothetical protein